MNRLRFSSWDMITVFIAGLVLGVYFAVAYILATRMGT